VRWAQKIPSSGVMVFSMREYDLFCRKDHGQTATYRSSRTDFGIEMPVPGCETVVLNSD
jgi:hypothetical protein